MSITKRQGIGGDSKVRRLARIGERVMDKGDIRADSRNGRRVMKKLREKYGDEAIDKEIERLRKQGPVK